MLEIAGFFIRAVVEAFFHIVVDWFLNSFMKGMGRLTRRCKQRRSQEVSSPSSSGNLEPLSSFSNDIESSQMSMIDRQRAQGNSSAKGQAPSTATRRKDGSIHAYGALVMCAASMLFGGWAIRSYRDEVMMQTMPAVPATVLELQERKNSLAAWIAFTRVSNGAPIACRTQIVLGSESRGLLVGSVVPVIPRPDSCGEPVTVGERNTTVLAALSGMALLVSLVLSVVAARSMMQPGRAGAIK